MEDFWLNGLMELFGPDTVQKWLDQAGGSEVLALRSIAEREIGKPEARGMFIRAGRASFYVWMRLNAEKLGWHTPEFRLLPGSAKAQRALQDFLGDREKSVSLSFDLSESENFWQVIFTCKAGKSDPQDCALLLGLIQELHGWANGGKFYSVEETRCQAVGAEACCLKIQKQPAI